MSTYIEKVLRRPNYFGVNENRTLFEANFRRNSKTEKLGKNEDF